MRRATRSTKTWSTLLITPGFFLLLHQKLTSPSFLFLCFLQVNLEFLGHFYLFSLCSSFFLLSALFALQIYPFLLPTFGFISTLAGAGLADSLFELLLHCPPGRAWPSSWASGAAVARGPGEAGPPGHSCSSHHRGCWDPLRGRWENRRASSLQVVVFIKH